MTGRMTRSRTRQAAEGSSTIDSDDERVKPSDSDARPCPKDLKLRDLAHAHCGTILPLHYKPANREQEERYAGVVEKERKLKDPDFQRSLQSSDAAQAAAATLVFAQHDAGTAVCISRAGLLLTCAHCIADADEDEAGVEVEKWLLFASGHPVLARCIAWDSKRDLALLQIIAQRRTRSHPSIQPQDPDWHLRTKIVSSLPYLPIAPALQLQKYTSTASATPGPRTSKPPPPASKPTTTSCTSAPAASWGWREARIPRITVRLGR